MTKGHPKTSADFVMKEIEYAADRLRNDLRNKEETIKSYTSAISIAEDGIKEGKMRLSKMDEALWILKKYLGP